jgi:hypothetical protein
MPVSIDEVTAEVEPERPAAAPGASTQSNSAPAREVEVRKHGDLHRHLECRAARVRAD